MTFSELQSLRNFQQRRERNKPNLTRVQIASQWGSFSRGTKSATQMRILDCPLTAQFHGHLLSNFPIELGPNSTYCEGHIFSKLKLFYPNLYPIPIIENCPHNASFSSKGNLICIWKINKIKFMYPLKDNEIK